MTTLDLDLQYIKTKSYAKIQLNISELIGERRRKNEYLLYSKFKKGYIALKNGAKWRFDLYYINSKSYAIFQLYMTEHVGEQCGKLHISHIPSYERGIYPSQIDEM